MRKFKNLKNLRNHPKWHKKYNFLGTKNWIVKSERNITLKFSKVIFFSIKKA